MWDLRRRGRISRIGPGSLSCEVVGEEFGRGVPNETGWWMFGDMCYPDRASGLRQLRFIIVVLLA